MFYCIDVWAYTPKHFSTSAKDEAMACIPLKLFNEANHYYSN
jgi:hypothetical protein